MIFPFGFFYGAIMTEGVFLMTCVLTLYYTRRHNWTLAAVFGFFAALSRSVGVFLIFPATVEFIEEYRLFESFKSKFILIFTKWSRLLLMPLGTCIYLWINYNATGNWFYFLEPEKEIWHQSGQLFYKTAGRLWEIIHQNYKVSSKMSAFVPGLIIMFFVYAVMLYGIRRHKSMYSIWVFVYLLVNTSMTWPLSLCRYLTACVPVYIILGDYCEKHKKAYTAFVIAFSILFGIYFTGYLMGKQIM